MQGVGNDFVVISAADAAGADWSQLSIALCSRHFGIGSDGLLIVDRSDRADYRMRMYNPDGTEDDCGNGLRCVVRYLRQYHTCADCLTIETLSGIHTAHILHHERLKSQVRVSM